MFPFQEIILNLPEIEFGGGVSTFMILKQDCSEGEAT